MIDANELTPVQREALLDGFRAQIGEEQYWSAVDKYGEDKLVELILTNIRLSSQKNSAQSNNNIPWDRLLYYVASLVLCGLLANFIHQPVVERVIELAIVLWLGSYLYQIASFSKSGGQVGGFIGLFLAIIGIITGIVFLFIPSLGWRYLLVALFLAGMVAIPAIVLLGGSTFQCEKCGSKNTEIVEMTLGRGAYADTARGTTRICRNCGHSQLPYV